MDRTNPEIPPPAPLLRSSSFLHGIERDARRTVAARVVEAERSVPFRQRLICCMLDDHPSAVHQQRALSERLQRSLRVPAALRGVHERTVEALVPKPETAQSARQRQLVHLRSFGEAAPLEVVSYEPARFTAVVDEGHACRSPAEGLQAERAGPGE